MNMMNRTSDVAAGQSVGGYAERQKIYPKLAHGKFRKLKWAVMAATLGIYYVLPWLRWDRGPNLPDQAFLLDFAHQRLFFGPIEIWAQELYYITGLLILSALGLFLVTAIAGRVWCGYACPQTVWTDLMIAVERIWQGDRNTRMRLDQSRWTFEKIWKKTGTHISWLLIAMATGGALVFYFRDAPTLAHELITGDAPAVAYVFLGVFTVSTYLLGGLAREQVCIYMCPWPRIQSAMFDQDSLLVTYRDWRGEPRGPHKKGQTWEGRGDCVDCTACVTVCPMGIDIRNGSQLECIQCALCIDACDEIMDRVGRPEGLIAYDTFRNLDAVTHDQRVPVRLIRPRTLIYTGVMLLVTAIMMAAWFNRAELEVSVLHDRNPIFVQLSDGSLRNGYMVKLLNKEHDTRRVRLQLQGLEGAQMQIVGLPGTQPTIEIVPDNLRALKVLVTVPAAQRNKLAGDSTPFRFSVIDDANGSVINHDATFRGPEPEHEAEHGHEHEHE